jgi:hypothetical protein
MNKPFAELLAAWIVAFALVAAIAAHTFLPKTPPHLAGVTPATAPRQAGGPVTPEKEMPLIEFGLTDNPSTDQDVATPAPSNRGSENGNYGARSRIRS